MAELHPFIPAPDDPIYIVIRLYRPKTEAPSILPPGEGEGDWGPPAVQMVKSS